MHRGLVDPLAANYDVGQLIRAAIVMINQFRAHSNVWYMRGDERIDATRVRFTLADAREAYYGFFARNRIASENHNLR